MMQGMKVVIFLIKLLRYFRFYSAQAASIYAAKFELLTDVTTSTGPGRGMIQNSFAK
jgi:hypothetical protein